MQRAAEFRATQANTETDIEWRPATFQHSVLLCRIAWLLGTYTNSPDDYLTKAEEAVSAFEKNPARSAHPVRFTYQHALAYEVRGRAKLAKKMRPKALADFHQALVLYRQAKIATEDSSPEIIESIMQEISSLEGQIEDLAQ